MSMHIENNCDGSGPHSGESVRVLPLGSDPWHGNLILCRACFAREIAWRKGRNAVVATPFALPQWEELTVYYGAGS